MWTSLKHICLHVVCIVVKIMTWCLLTNSLPAGKFTAVNCGNVTNLKKVINDATEEKRLKMAAMYYLFLLKYS